MHDKISAPFKVSKLYAQELFDLQPHLRGNLKQQSGIHKAATEFGALQDSYSLDETEEEK